MQGKDSGLAAMSQNTAHEEANGHSGVQSCPCLCPEWVSAESHAEVPQVQMKALSPHMASHSLEQWGLQKCF